LSALVSTATMGKLSFPQTIQAKTQTAEPLDAGYFDRLANRETAKNLKSHEMASSEIAPSQRTEAIDTDEKDLAGSQAIQMSVSFDFRALGSLHHIWPLHFSNDKDDRSDAALIESASPSDADAFEGATFVTCKPGEKKQVSNLQQIRVENHQGLEAKKLNPGTKTAFVAIPDIANEHSFDLAGLQQFAVQLAMPNEAQTSSQTTRLLDFPYVTRIQIEQVKRNATGALTSLEFVLEPAELGRITAKIQHEEGRMTLILNAEHQHIAEDIARDGGMLLRVLGDHIPGVERMIVHIQSGASQLSMGAGSNFSHLRSDQQGKNQQSRSFFDGGDPESDIPHGTKSQKKITTYSRVLI
jgi:flagellar hook-length control protein FliK